MLGKYSAQDILLITAITNLHVGTGRGGEVVDLPIQRDSYGFPTIYSSSFKGAIKSYIYSKLNKFTEILFGPDGSGEFASPVALSDAYLLAFPARSLKGVYCYLTCPLLLKRFKEYADMIGYKFENEIEILLEKPQVYTCDNPQNISIGEKAVINEELVLENLSINKGVAKLKELLTLDKELVIIDDDECLKQVDRSLIRLTRVRLNRSSKTVEHGPWTEEYVPSKTTFFSTIYYSKPPNSVLDKYEKDESLKNLKSQIIKELEINEIKDIDETKIRNYLEKNLKLLVIGGHETVGSGIVKLRFLKPQVAQPSQIKGG
jgi:CRISPR-associated protein Cmr4